MADQSHTTVLRREVLQRVAHAFMQTETADEVEAIPFTMRPKGGKHNHCCIHHDRAILRYRCMAAMGFLPEDEHGDDSIPLKDFVNKAMIGDRDSASSVISACHIACHGCAQARHFVTDICQGCIAQPCILTCHFGAIQVVVHGQAQIDIKKCRNCGLCQKVCPYSAIVKLSVPCESACPVDAIRKTESGRAEIALDKCISCGRCMLACPFGALLMRSEMVDVLRLLREKEHVTAMLSPATAGQFAIPLPKIFGAFKALGFSEVMEVAVGADITSRHEAEEFVERMGKGERFMTTSCCAGYIQAVRRLIPELGPFVSDTLTPMHYTAELAAQKAPGTKTVFIGPCVAKCVEGRENPAVAHVITFEELGAIFNAANINLDTCSEEALIDSPSSTGRKYALSGGVAAAVSSLVDGRVEVVPVQVNGLTLKGLRQLRSYAMGVCPGNLVEVMACEGGCVGGSGVIADRVKAARAVDAFATGT